WLKAVRHVVQDEPDEQFLRGAAFNRGVAALHRYGLVYDLLIFARQLPEAIAFVDAHPQQLMVLDHIAKPTITPSQFDSSWERNFRELARRQQVRCKFSGVVTEIRTQAATETAASRASDWSIDQIRRYWDVALEAFTPKRL